MCCLLSNSSSLCHYFSNVNTFILRTWWRDCLQDYNIFCSTTTRRVLCEMNFANFEPLSKKLRFANLATPAKQRPNQRQHPSLLTHKLPSCISNMVNLWKQAWGTFSSLLYVQTQDTVVAMLSWRRFGEVANKFCGKMLLRASNQQQGVLFDFVVWSIIVLNFMQCIKQSFTSNWCHILT